MRPASVKINLGDSHKSESFPGDKRLERKSKKQKRREAMNVSLKQNCFVSATRTSAKTCGNMSADKNDHMTGDEEIDDDYITYLNARASDEVDEDYKLFLDDYNSDDPGDSNVCGSNIDVNTGYNNINDDGDEEDDDYIMYLDTHNSDIDSAYDEMDEDCTLFWDKYVSDNDSPSENNVDGSNIDVNTGYNNINDDGDEVNDGYVTYLDTHDSDIDSAYYEIDEDCTLLLDTYVSDNDSPSDNNVGGSNIDCNQHDHMWYEGEEEQEEGEGERFRNEPKLETKTSNVEDESKTSKAFDTCEVQCDSEEDSKAFLNSGSVLLYRLDKNTTKTSKVEDGSNSSDSDLIILEPYLICENTPFVSSKTYDSSFFEKEWKPRDGRQLYADDHSPFRRRLMENLERPYDHHEYIQLLEEVYQQKETESHLETRRGEVPTYHTKDVSKSYLEAYPDLLKAIIELKAEAPKVLFLLRGFFFWLQNLPHDGVFRPWLDKSCLETLRKL